MRLTERHSVGTLCLNCLTQRTQRNAENAERSCLVIAAPLATSRRFFGAEARKASRDIPSGGSQERIVRARCGGAPEGPCVAPLRSLRGSALSASSRSVVRPDREPYAR